MLHALAEAKHSLNEIMESAIASPAMSRVNNGNNVDARLQSREDDGDENRKDQGEFDRGRASFVARQLSPQSTHPSEEFAHGPHRRQTATSF